MLSKESMHIPHLAPDTAPTPEAFAALVLTAELTLLELLTLLRLRTLPPVILTCAVVGWRLTRIFDAGYQTSKLQS